MINSVIACLFLFLFGAVLFVVNATAPFPCAEWQWGALGTRADLTLYIPTSSFTFFLLYLDNSLYEIALYLYL